MPAQTLEQRAAEALALPGVGHGERELRGLAIRVGRVASHGDELAAVQRDERELAVVVELREARQQRGGRRCMLLHEALVARALGERIEEALLERGILRAASAAARAACRRRAASVFLELDRIGWIAMCP